jgi:hypothetical protein
MALTQAKETRETGEPDAVKVARPVRRGAGRKGGLADLARGLPYLLRRSGFRQQLKAGVRLPFCESCVEEDLSREDSVLYDASRTDIGLYLMCSELSSVSSIERFVARYIRGQIPQPLVETSLVRQEHTRHTVDYVSRNETFANSFGRQT